MAQYIGNVTLVVRDYDEAIAFYTGKLGFTLSEDTSLGDTKRWVVVRPPGENGCGLLLAKADGEEQISRIGNQTGGRVFMFLYTDNFWADYEKLQQKEVVFKRLPVKEVYGTVAVFEDLYGNLWDFIGPVK